MKILENLFQTIPLLNKPYAKKLLIALILFSLFCVSFPFIFRAIIQRTYQPAIYDVSAVPETQVALVFGAGIYEDGRMSDMLKDRMDVAIALYEAGKVNKLLLSGDNSFETYDEPSAMMAYALEQGVPEADLQPDYGGRRTYDSCYRAKEIFQVDQAVLVTQNFHLPRAMFLCDQLGMETVGVSADLQPYIAARWMAIREVGATLQSGADIVWQAPSPIMGEPIPITE